MREVELEVSAAKMKRFRAKHVAMRNDDGVVLVAPHGTARGYRNYMCRCVKCVDANVKYLRFLREERSRLNEQTS